MEAPPPLTELIEILVSGKKVGDSGLSEVDADTSKRIDAIREDAIVNLKALRKRIALLERHGVKAEEQPGADPDSAYTFAHANHQSELMCKAAFAVGYYYALIESNLLAFGPELVTQLTAKKAGDLGGIAVSTAANEREKEILRKYAAWAEKAKDGERIRSFSEQLSKEKTKVRGYGKSTIEKVIAEFNAKVLAVRSRVGTSGRVSPALITRVVTLMNDAPGVSPATVRRALQ